MHIRFKTIEGKSVDVIGDLIQLIDNGENSETYEEGDRRRYQVMVGEEGWCHLLTKSEYESLKIKLASAGSRRYPLNEDT